MHYSLQICYYVNVHTQYLYICWMGSLLRLVEKERLKEWGRFDSAISRPFVMDKRNSHKHEISSEMTQITRNSIADWTRSFEIKGSRQRQMRWKMYLVNRLMSMFELSLFCSLDNLKSLPLSLSLESNWYQLQFISAFLLLIRDKHALAYESESSASNLISTTSSLSTIT